MKFAVENTMGSLRMSHMRGLLVGVFSGLIHIVYSASSAIGAIAVTGEFNGWNNNGNVFTTTGTAPGYARISINPSQNSQFLFNIAGTWDNWKGSDWWVPGNEWGAFQDVPYNNANNMRFNSTSWSSNYKGRLIVTTTTDETKNAAKRFWYQSIEADPINISSVSGGTSNVDWNTDVTISITLSAAKSASELVLIRYSTTSNFASSSFVTATGSGTSYSAVIPKQAVGTTVYWYAMTSTSANPGANADPLTISFLRNGASNFSYSVTKRNQTITFNSLSAQTFGGANFNLSATASSGLGVTYTSSNTGVATVSGSTVTIVGAGSTTITASQGGDSQWNAASNVQQTLTVNKANQGAVTGSLSANAVSIGSTVTATASGGTGTGAYEFRQNGGTAGAVTFASSGNPRTITGAVAGTAPIEVRRVGDTNYNDSSWVSAGTLTVSAAATAPAVSNGAASSIAQTTATLAGDVTGNGGSNITERGFVYSTSDTTPTIAEGAMKQTTTGTTGAMSQAISGLTANTTYYYNAYAINSVGTSYGTAANFTTLPNAPSAPNAPTGSSVSATGFTATWNAPAGAVSYLLDVSTASNFASFVGSYNGFAVAGTSQAITGLTANTTYYVRVRAVNTGGTSSNSGTLTQLTAPAAPLVPTSSNVAPYSFTVTWSAVTGAVDYRLDVSTSSTFAQAGEIAGFTNLTVSGTSQAVTVPTPNTTYYVRVRAVNAGGTSDQSPTLTVATLPMPDGNNRETGVNATTSWVGDRVSLEIRAWRDWNSIARSGAQIFGRYGNANLTTGTVTGESNNPGNTTDGFSAWTPRFNQAGDFFWALRVSYGSNHFWFDAPRNGWSNLGIAAPSNSPLKIVVSALNDPTSVTASAASPTSITVSWANGVSGNEKWTTVFRSTSSTPPALEQGTVYAVDTNHTLGGQTYRCIALGAATSVTDSGLTPGTTYYYYVYAENNSHYSPGVSRTVSLSSDFTYTTTSDTTESTGLAGSGNLTKNGSAELFLTGNNTYSGTTTINAGRLRINADSRLGTAPASPVANSITIGAAILALDGAITLNANRGITLTGTATIDDWGNNDTYNGIIATGSGATTSLTKIGGGILTLGGHNTYTGGTTVNNGAVQLTHANALGATGEGNGTTVSSGFALRLENNIEVGNELLTISGGGIQASSVDTGALRSLSGDNSWAGAITLAAGARINSDTSANTLTLSGGITGGANVLFVGGAGNTTVSGAITGAGATQDSVVTSVYKDGAGTLTLSGANTYTGITRINAGNLTVSGSGTLGSGSAVRIASGATLTVNANVAVAGVREIGNGNGGTVNIGNGNTLTVNGENQGTFFQSSINGAGGNLTFSGTGTTVLSLYNAQGYTGTTTVSSGILTSSGAMSTATVNINGGTFRLTDGGTVSGADINLGSGGTFDVAGTTSGTSLGASKGLTAAATGANTTGTITVATGKDYSLGTGSLNFSAYGGGATAPLTVSGTGGNLNLNSRAVSVSSTTQLAAGTYKLIAKSGTANVTGTPGTLTMGGSGLAANTSGALSVSNGELVLTVTVNVSAPVVTGATFSGTVGTAFNESVSASNSPTSYAVASGTLPAGLTLNTSTGAITGTPTAAASGTTVSISATNAGGTGSASFTFNIAKGTPSITAAPTASAITFGQTLASSTLSGGTASVAGGFAFTTSSTAPNAGTAAQSVTFTPTDTANYNTTTTTVNVTVNAASLPTVTFTAPASLVYNRTAKTHTAIATGPSSLTLTYTGRNSTTYNSTTAPTNVGDYTVTATTSDGNYTGSQAQNFSITAKGLTVTGLTGANKVYDRTTAATATGTAALSGVESGDTVTLTGTPTFTFASANVGTGISISTTGYTLGGGQAGNYSLAQPTLSANITAKGLTVTGLTGANKVYDRTTAATATGTAALSGVESGDTVTLTGTPTFTFASANVGTGISISTTGYTLGGTHNANYSLTQPTLSANITAKGLTVSGASATSRAYNATTTVVVSGGSLVGVESGDTVTLDGSPSGTVASANVGTGKAVTVTGYSISGASSTNYSLTQPTGLTVDITAKALTITAPTIASKVYDGTATAGAVTVGTLSGLVGSETVTATATAANYSSANVGSYPGVVVTYSLADGTNGGLASNYSLAAGSATGVITAASLASNQITLSSTNGTTYAVSGPGGSTFDITYSGRTVGTLTNTYSSTLAPTGAGYYRVTADATGNYSGSKSEDYYISGPVAVSDAVSRPTATMNIPLATLLQNDKRIDSSGNVQTNGLSITGVATGTGTPTVSLGASFVSFNPNGSGNKTFTYTLSDSVANKTATGTVAVSAIVWDTAFMVTGTRGTAVHADGITEITLTFTGEPNVTYWIQYRGEMNHAWKDVGGVYSENGTFEVYIWEEGNHAADWNGSMFFQATR